MDELEQFERLKRNILGVSLSTADAPYHGISRETINGIDFAVDKALDRTGITISSLLEESREKCWFQGEVRRSGEIKSGNQGTD